MKALQQRSARPERKLPWYLLHKFLYEKNIRILWRILETVTTVLRGGLPGSGQVNHVQEKSLHSNTWHRCVRLGSCMGKMCSSHTWGLTFGIHFQEDSGLGTTKAANSSQGIPSCPPKRRVPLANWCLNENCMLFEDSRPLAYWCPMAIPLFYSQEFACKRKRNSRDVVIAKNRKENHSRQCLTSNCKEVQVSIPYASELCFWLFPHFLGRALLMHARTCSWKSEGAGSTNLW